MRCYSIDNDKGITEHLISLGLSPHEYDRCDMSYVFTVVIKEHLRLINNLRLQLADTGGDNENL